jgi:hypothetical protein
MTAPVLHRRDASSKVLHWPKLFEGQLSLADNYDNNYAGGEGAGRGYGYYNGNGRGGGYGDASGGSWRNNIVNGFGFDHGYHNGNGGRA